MHKKRMKVSRKTKQGKQKITHMFFYDIYQQKKKLTKTETNFLIESFALLLSLIHIIIYCNNKTHTSNNQENNKKKYFYS